MKKIRKRRRVIAWVGASVLVLLLSALPIRMRVPAIDGRALVVVALVCLALGISMAIRASLHRVPEGYVDVAYTFSRYRRTLYAGTRIRFPWEKMAARLRVDESFWVCPPQLVPLSYDHSVVLSCAVSYRLAPEKAHLAVRTPQDWEETLRELLVISLQGMGTTLSPQDLLAWSSRAPSPSAATSGDMRASPWERVNLNLLRRVRARATPLGVQVNWVAIRDVSLVQQAFPRVITGQEAARISDSGAGQYFTQHSHPTEALPRRQPL